MKQIIAEVEKALFGMKLKAPSKAALFEDGVELIS
jgi:hypothetical protein